ncbi:type I methionyl aminopeptidase [Microbulbifer sp. 2304DJ12-6]|uniref:type I methionyl aminopeptidase n=1 Tax=Microbulbifer sp. 2304DJ12-6 TaxID=3233340 RepID=UPI0039B10ECA
MNNIRVKTAREQTLMRDAGRLLSRVFAMLDSVISPGISTMEINDRAEAFIVGQLRARPASKGQYNYPYALNTSVNDAVCHGLPQRSLRLRNGDIVNVDITLEKSGYIADASKMYMVGRVTSRAKKLVHCCYNALWAGIHVVKPGATLGDIGHAIQNHAERGGFSVVREYCGHGIGREMHEAPQILHYGRAGTGLVLREGMTFTIEPMINQGNRKTKVKKDGWTVVTRDGKLSAQWEHTLLVTDRGCEVLTLREEEKSNDNTGSQRTPARAV